LNAEHGRHRATCFGRGVFKSEEVGPVSVGAPNDVIDPAETRRWLMRGLRMVAQRPARDGKRQPFADAW